MGFLKHLIKGMYRDAYYRRHHQNHDYDQHHRGSYGTGYPSSSGIFLSIKNFIGRNKKIVYILFAVVGLILLLMIVLLVALLPMILSGINYLYNYGLKGVVDILLGLSKMLWEGSGK
jgi:lipopolysaccharide/colanic/teichoic acid biosynthesis glycosyltransferase